MKVALVRKDNKQIAMVIDKVEADSLMVSTPYKATYESISVPASLETRSTNELQVVAISPANEYWSDGTTIYNAVVDVPTITDANSNVIQDPSFIHYPEVLAHDEIHEDLVAVKLGAIASLKSTATEEVYTELFNRFGSRDSANVTANFTTWKEMVSDPTLFVGTYATHDSKDSTGTIMVTKGAKLIDAPMVTTYASNLVLGSKDYLLWRINRYKTLSDAISLL